MEFSEIKTKNASELNDLLAEKKEELRVLRFKLQSQQLKQMHKINDAKKFIARIKTALTVKANTPVVKQEK